MAGVSVQLTRNGEIMSWANVELHMLGRQVIGIQALEYMEETQMDEVFGAGQENIGVGFGNVSRTASMTLLLEEVQGLRLIAPQGKLFLIPPFSITVAFIPKTGGVPLVDTLYNVRIKKDGFGITQGQTSIPVEMPLHVGGIRWAAALRS